MAFGSIKGITIEFRGDTTKLDKALRTVKSEAKSTQNELKSIDRALKFNPRSVDMWKQKQTVLNNAIKDTQEKLRYMRQALDEMSRQGLNSENSEEFRRLSREIDQAERELREYENQLRAIGNANLQALGNQFKDIGSKMTDVGKKMSMYVTVPLVGVGAAAAKGFAEVDKVMQLTNATMGNTADQAELLNQAMKDAASNSTYGMEEAATATLNFARAGLTAEQAASALAPAMNLAAGEGGDLDTVSAGLVATINGFHGSFEDAAAYADVFANACNNSALDIDSLSQAMSVAAPVFSAAGYSVNDAALYMGVMANNGIEADKAANSLKTGMARLVSPSKDAAGWMDKLGISITNSDGSMKDSVTVQKELHDAFGQLSGAEQIAAASAIFGKNQMAPWLALINTAPGDVDALSTALEAEGTTAEMAESMMSGFGGSLEKLKSSIDVAKVSLGEALAPIILKVAEGIQSLIDWFNNLSPSMQRVVGVIGVVVAAIGPLLVIFGTLMSSIGSIMINFGRVAGVFGKFAGAIKAAFSILSGLGGVIKGIVLALGWWGVAIAAAIAAGILLYKNWDKIKKFAKKLWTTIKPIFQKMGDFITKTWDKVKTTVTTVWNNIQKTIKEKVNAAKNTITNVFNAIKSFLTTVLKVYVTLVKAQFTLIKATIETILKAVKTVVTTIFNAIKTVITTVLNAIKTTVTTAWNAIKTAITTALNAIKTAITNAFNAIKTFITNSVNGWKTIITNAWNGIKTVVTTAVNAVKTTVTNVFNAIKTFITSSVNGWKTIITNAWNGIKKVVTAAVNAVKTKVTSVFNSVKTSVTSIWNGIKTAISNAINAAKKTVSNVVSTIKSTVSNAFSGLGSKVRSAFNAVKDAISSPIQKAWDLVQSAVNKIKSIFPINLGKIFSGVKLPHFKISGGKVPWGIGGKGTPPRVWIEWYKKGAIFTKPTLFATGSGFKGVGEAGAEAVLPLSELWEQMAGMGNTIVQGVTANQQRQDYLLEQLVTLNALMLEQLKADKDFKIDGRVAGRIINDLVRV